jgi:hypothetical protein
VVVTATGGLSPEVAAAGAGRTTASLPDADNGSLVAEAILDLLPPEANETASLAAWNLVRDRFSIEAVVDDLLPLYTALHPRR